MVTAKRSTHLTKLTTPPHLQRYNNASKKWAVLSFYYSISACMPLFSYSRAYLINPPLYKALHAPSIWDISKRPHYIIIVTKTSVSKYYDMMRVIDFFLLILLLSCFHVSMAGRSIPPSSVPSTMRPLSEDYMKMKPLWMHKHGVFHAKQVKNCMPKGFRHASAPSRFVNSQTLGGCSNKPKPWCMFCSHSQDKITNQYSICPICICSFLSKFMASFISF